MGEMIDQLMQRAQNAYTGVNRDPNFADTGSINPRSFTDEHGGDLELRNAQVIASLLARDEQGFADILKEHAPEIDVTTDANGRVMVAMPGRPPEYINEPGFSGADTMGIVRDLATFFPAARMASLGRAAATRMGLGAAGGAGTYAGRDVAAIGAGSDQPVDLLGAGVTGAAEGLTMGLWPGGRPAPGPNSIRAYHGTKADFRPRDYDLSESLHDDQGWFGRAMYHAPTKERGDTWAGVGGTTQDNWITARNPYRFARNEFDNSEPDSFNGIIGMYDDGKYGAGNHPTGADVRQYLLDQGYDAVYSPEWGEYAMFNPSTQVQPYYRPHGGGQAPTAAATGAAQSEDEYRDWYESVFGGQR